MEQDRKEKDLIDLVEKSSKLLEHANNLNNLIKQHRQELFKESCDTHDIYLGSFSVSFLAKSIKEIYGWDTYDEAVNLRECLQEDLYENDSNDLLYDIEFWSFVKKTVETLDAEKNLQETYSEIFVEKVDYLINKIDYLENSEFDLEPFVLNPNRTDNELKRNEHDLTQKDLKDTTKNLINNMQKILNDLWNNDYISP